MAHSLPSRATCGIALTVLLALLIGAPARADSAAPAVADRPGARPQPTDPARRQADDLLGEMETLWGRLVDESKKQTYRAAIGFSKEQLTNALDLVSERPADDEAKAQLVQAFELATNTRDNLRRSVDTEPAEH